MRFIKYFKQLFESITFVKNKDAWKIEYNHGVNHNLDDKLLNRTDMTEINFKECIDAIIKIIENEKLNGDYAFISIKNNAKIIVNISLNIKRLYIVTILGKNENLKNNQNYKLI